MGLLKKIKINITKIMVLSLISGVILLPAGAVKSLAEEVATPPATEIENEIKEEKSETNKEKITSLSLQDSIDLAIKNDPDLAVAKIEHEQAKVNLKRAKDGAKDISNARKVPKSVISAMDPIASATIYTYDAYLAEAAYPRAMEMAEKLTDKSIEFQENVLKFQVENAYYTVLKAEKELQNASDSLYRAKEQLRIANVGFNVGTNAKVDVIGAEVLVSAQELAHAHAKNSLKQVRMDFNDLIGLSLDDEVKLTSTFAFSPVVFDLEKIGKTAREKDLTYIQLHENREVQKETFEVAKSYYTPNVYTYKEAQQNLEIAELNLKNVEQDLDLKIEKAFLTTETAKERHKLMEKSVEQATESYRLTKLRYEVGMATLLDMEKANGDVDKAKIELLSAIYDYNLAATMLEHGIFLTSSTGGMANGN